MFAKYDRSKYEKKLKKHLKRDYRRENDVCALCARHKRAVNTMQQLLAVEAPWTLKRRYRNVAWTLKGRCKDDVYTLLLDNLIISSAFRGEPTAC